MILLCSHHRTPGNVRMKGKGWEDQERWEQKREWKGGGRGGGRGGEGRGRKGRGERARRKENMISLQLDSEEH